MRPLARVLCGAHNKPAQRAKRVRGGNTVVCGERARRWKCMKISGNGSRRRGSTANLKIFLGSPLPAAARIERDAAGTAADEPAGRQREQKLKPQKHYIYIYIQVVCDSVSTARGESPDTRHPRNTPEFNAAQ